jgi:hypothetical protein
VSHHGVTDGKPLADDLVHRIVEGLQSRMNATIIPAFTSPDTTKESLIAQLPTDVKGLEPFSEITFAIPVGAIFEFRQIIKSYTVVDHTGRPANLSESGIGSLVSIVVGNKLRELAVQRGIVSRRWHDRLAGLASHADIFKQLLQVNLSGLALPEEINDWFTINSATGKPVIRLSQQFAPIMHTANIAFTDPGSNRNRTETVDEVFGLPPQLWGINAWASKRILSGLASGHVGPTMISVLNTKLGITGGPALVAGWQDVAVTGSAVENGLMILKMKTSAHDQQESLELAKELISYFSDWDARSRILLLATKNANF